MKSEPVIGTLLALAASSPMSALAQETPASTPPSSPELHEGFTELRPLLEERTAEHHGIVGLVLLDSRTAEIWSIRGEEEFPSPSIIKLPILYEVMLRVEEGRLSLDDPLIVLAEERVGGPVSSSIFLHRSRSPCATPRRA